MIGRSSKGDTMPDNRPATESSNEPMERKPYQSPHLTPHGGLRTLTLGGGVLTETDDGSGSALFDSDPNTDT